MKAYNRTPVVIRERKMVSRRKLRRSEILFFCMIFLLIIVFLVKC